MSIAKVHDATFIDGVPATFKTARIVALARLHALIADSAPKVLLTYATNANFATEVADSTCLIVVGRGYQAAARNVFCNG
jgi:hypothetical protein